MTEKKLKNKNKKIKEDFIIEEVIETKPLTNEERIFGVQAPTVKAVKCDYRNPKRFYNVFICANGRTIQVNGVELGAFLGLQYVAKKDLENGCSYVELKDKNGKLEYKIEVIN